MATIIGKTVYILGAGASVHTGAPLLADFLSEARRLPYRVHELPHRDAFERVFAWIDQLKAASYTMDVNLDNLEHVFSLAELGRQLGQEECEKHYEDLRHVIFEVLDHCEILEKGNGPVDATYGSFVKLLKRHNDARLRNHRSQIDDFSTDAVVTLNYDVFLDEAFGTSGLAVDYSVGNDKVDGIPLLKLHGSTNWKCCRQCARYVKFIAPHALHNHLIQVLASQSGGGLGPTYLRVVPGSRVEEHCPDCGKNTNWEPLIIPPTWSKQVTDNPISRVWSRAIKEISRASQLVIIGYSLPPTDTFFQYLLTLAASPGSHLDRVVLVNTDGTDAFKNRYRGMFSRSLAKRGKLLLVKLDFRRFCGSPMDGCLSSESVDLCKEIEGSGGSTEWL